MSRSLSLMPVGQMQASNTPRTPSPILPTRPSHASSLGGSWIQQILQIYLLSLFFPVTSLMISSHFHYESLPALKPLNGSPSSVPAIPNSLLWELLRDVPQEWVWRCFLLLLDNYNTHLHSKGFDKSCSKKKKMCPAWFKLFLQVICTWIPPHLPNSPFIYISLFMSRKVGFHRNPVWETVTYTQKSKIFNLAFKALHGKSLEYTVSLTFYLPALTLQIFQTL